MVSETYGGDFFPLGDDGRQWWICLYCQPCPTCGEYGTGCGDMPWECERRITEL